jgi:hypothetical protein
MLLLYSEELFLDIDGTDCGSVNYEDLCKADASGQLETPIALPSDWWRIIVGSILVDILYYQPNLIEITTAIGTNTSYQIFLHDKRGEDKQCNRASSLRRRIRNVFVSRKRLRLVIKLRAPWWCSSASRPATTPSHPPPCTTSVSPAFWLTLPIRRPRCRCLPQTSFLKPPLVLSPLAVSQDIDLHHFRKAGISSLLSKSDI